MAANDDRSPRDGDDDPVREEQEGKGYGADPGERDEALEAETSPGES